jgi:RNA-directed DNA polymerase
MTVQAMKFSRSMTGASPAVSTTWANIKWPAVEKNVKRLQMRIAKAIRSERFGKAKALQRILTHSFYGKCLAVKRVALNKGSKTPGVDNILWRTNCQKMKAVMSLKRKGYKPQPLKRIYIPKTKDRLRPLSLPTMKDRAMQALWKLALEPICEEQADPNTYGFRPKRCTADAIEQCLLNLSKKSSAKWVLEGDIKSCFDTISHEWLLENIPMDKIILDKFLKAGFMEKDRYFLTEEGTPQGGIISPTLTVMALSGLERALR